MRRAAKVDRNQPEIVAALRDLGASVQPLHAVGQGCPDLLVGFRGLNILIEVKDHKASKSDQKLNPRQQEWHQSWRGQATKVSTVEEAWAAIGVQHPRSLRNRIVGEAE